MAATSTLPFVAFSFLFLFLGLAFSESEPSPAPSLQLPADSPFHSPPFPAPSLPPADSPLSAPPAPPPSDLTPGVAPSPANSPKADDAPAPSPADASDINHSDNATSGNEVADGGSSGMSGGKKAGIVFGVLAAACLVGLAGFVYKKRQENIRRSQYSHAARGLL